MFLILAFLGGLLAGLSIGRQGPSVQIAAGGSALSPELAFMISRDSRPQRPQQFGGGFDRPPPAGAAAGCSAMLKCPDEGGKTGHAAA